MTDIEKVIEEIKKNCDIIGNNSLKTILEQDPLDTTTLYKEIRKHNSELTLYEEELEEGEVGPTYLIFLSSVCLDPKNIGKIELTEDYNSISQKQIYSITIFPKFSKGVEGEEVTLNFKTESIRDYYFDILKIKLKRVLINIY